MFGYDPWTVNQVWVEPGDRGYVQAVCPEGNKVLGGGFATGNYKEFEVVNSNPNIEGAHWTVSAWNKSSTATYLYAYAICADV